MSSAAIFIADAEIPAEDLAVEDERAVDVGEDVGEGLFELGKAGCDVLAVAE